MCSNRNDIASEVKVSRSRKNEQMNLYFYPDSPEILETCCDAYKMLVLFKILQLACKNNDKFCWDIWAKRINLDASVLHFVSTTTNF